MDQKEKAILALYAIIYALTALAAFRLGDIVPVPTVYVLLGSLYLIPIWLATTRQLDAGLAAVLVVVTPLLSAIIVVDPLEVGFYGHDPYFHTLPAALEFSANGPVNIARNRLAWPGFYSFLWAVTSTIDLPVETVGKYLPLIAVVTPMLVYLFARRVISHRTAFVAAMGFAGVRTLYTFQVKFLDETTAFIMFFLLLFLLVLRFDLRTSAVSYLALLVSVGAVFTHHYVGALVGLLLVLWDLSSFEIPRGANFQGLEWPFSRLTIVTGVVFAAMILIVVPQMVGFIVSVADPSLSPSSETFNTPQAADDTPTPERGTPEASAETSTPSNETPTPERDTPEASGGSGQTGNGGILQTVQNIPIQFWKLLATNVVLISILFFVLISIRIWTIDSHPALLVSGIFGSLLAAGYGYSVAFGPIIPVDPSRYLLYMTGALLVVAGYALSEMDLPIDSSSAFSILVVSLILTQLVVVSPLVMYSSQERTSVSEEHFSPSQFAASDWMGRYGGDRVVGWELGVWAVNDIRQIDYASATGDCSVSRVWRREAPVDHMKETDNLFYDAGIIKIYQCN